MVNIQAFCCDLQLLKELKKTATGNTKISVHILSNASLEGTGKQLNIPTHIQR